MKRWALFILRTVAIVYGAILLLVVLFQRSLIYLPSRGTEDELFREAARVGLDPWRDADGKLIGWRKTTPGAARKLVVFHGNAGQAVNRDYYADAFSALGWDVFILEYPGYGARGGSPSKDAFISAGQSAVEELLKADARPVYLLGESIGSGTACALAGLLPDRIAGVALILPFARLAEVGQKAMPIVPVHLLLRDKFDNIGALASYRGPVVVVVAENDEVIGAEQGRKLHAAYAGPKHLCELPDCGHNNFPNGPREAWWREVAEFLAGKP